MSYLSAIRLHFSGKFVADVPTLDNKPENHRLALLDQEIPGPDRGFNANGSGAFWLENCLVRSAYYKNGTRVLADPILGMQIASAEPKGKMADLDCEQQTVATIYGLQVRLLTAGGADVFAGTLEPASAADLWNRCAQCGINVFGMAASFQSVITEVTWADLQIDETEETLGGSRFLHQLHKLAPNGGELSIKFNLDAFRKENRGRIVGTIGPVMEDEPRHFVRGRHLLARMTPKAAPEGRLFHSVAVVDNEIGQIRVDLGNALPMDPKPRLVDLGTMNLECVELDANGDFVARTVIGKIDYLAQEDLDWYETSAGIAILPLPETDISELPLAITLPSDDKWSSPALMETPGGLHVQAQEKICRLEAEESATINLLATRFGEPLPDARVVAYFDTPVAATDVGLDFERWAATNSDGWAQITLTAGATVVARDFTDSRLYLVRYALEETLNPSLRYPHNHSDIISLLVWRAFQPEAPKTTWSGTVKLIFRKYANLFPVMGPIVDLKDYEAVCAMRTQLIEVMSLPETSPHYMPVSRDLSPSKRAAIIEWLSDLSGPGGKPLFGTSST